MDLYQRYSPVTGSFWRWYGMQDRDPSELHSWSRCINLLLTWQCTRCGVTVKDKLAHQNNEDVETARKLVYSPCRGRKR